MGLPRTGLLTSISSLAAASATRCAADLLASPLRHTSAQSSSVCDEPISHRCIAVITRAKHAVVASYPLLLARSGRHAHDETGCARTAHRSNTRPVVDVTVKNLRIAASTVLLLNFFEVSRLRLCSTGVTM